MRDSFDDGCRLPGSWDGRNQDAITARGLGHRTLFLAQAHAV